MTTPKAGKLLNLYIVTIGQDNGTAPWKNSLAAAP